MSRVVTNEEKTYVNLHRTVPLTQCCATALHVMYLYSLNCAYMYVMQRVYYMSTWRLDAGS